MVCHPVLFEHPKSVSGASIGFKDNFLILHTQVAFSFGMCVVLLLYWPGTFQVFAPPLVAAHLFLYHFDLLDDFGSDFTFGAGVFGAFSFSRSFWRFLSIALIWFRNGLSHMLLVSTMFPTSGHNVYIYIYTCIYNPDLGLEGLNQAHQVSHCPRVVRLKASAHLSMTKAVRTDGIGKREREEDKKSTIAIKVYIISLLLCLLFLSLTLISFWKSWG